MRDERGAAAVEFGLIAIPFFAILFAIIETAVVFWSQQVLETALGDTVRQLYTGRFQQANTTGTNAQLIAKLKATLCSPNGPPPAAQRPTIFDCSKVVINVTLAPATPPPAIVNGQMNPGFAQYSSPGPKQIVLVRAAVEFPVFVKLLNPNQANLANGNRVLMASAAFKTEPYQ